MRKIIFFLGLLVITSLCKVSAQYLYFWNGDMRIGFSAGVSHPFVNLNVVSENMNFDDYNTAPFVSPSFGLFSGMEKELSGNFAFGYNVWFTFQKSSLTFNFSSPAYGSNPPYAINSKVQSTNIDGYEYVYVAYYLTEQLSLSIGLGLNQDISFNSKVINTFTQGSEPTDLDMYYPSSHGNFGLALSLNFATSLGVTYNINESFFVSAHLNTGIFTILGTDTFNSSDDTFYMNNLGYNNYYAASINRCSLLATIGFKW